MPLVKRARIEIYLPERGDSNYARLQKALENEFLLTFGGCTVIKNIIGTYLGSDGETDTDRIRLIYADTPFDPDENFEALSNYTEDLRSTALEATEEESILVVVHKLYHAV